MARECVVGGILKLSPYWEGEGAGGAWGAGSRAFPAEEKVQTL